MLSSVAIERQTASLSAIRAVRGNSSQNWIPGMLVLIGLTENRSFITDVTVFILACIVGWQVIWNVTPALHTPLMSVTNAISGIIVVGGMVQLGVIDSAAKLLGAVAVFVATINIAGGFLVTHRMLKMFHK